MDRWTASGRREKQSEGEMKVIPLSGSVQDLIANKNRWWDSRQGMLKISCAVGLLRNRIMRSEEALRVVYLFTF